MIEEQLMISGIIL